MPLCEQLRPCASKWDLLAKELDFKVYEIDNLKANPMNLISAPFSYLNEIISLLLNRAPGDARGSKNYATLDDLKDAVERAGFLDVAKKLAIS